MSDQLAKALRAILNNSYVGKHGTVPLKSKWVNYPAHLYHAAQEALTLPDDWSPIERAPYSTPVKIKVGNGMEFVARLEPGASMSGLDTSCDQWRAEYEGEHPECWHDGSCWESNADEVASLQPTAWRPLTERETSNG